MEFRLRSQRARALFAGLLLTAAGVHGQASPAATSGNATVRPLTRSADELRSILGSIPQLSTWAPEWRPLPSRATDDALERGHRTRTDLTGSTLVEGAFEWAPRADRKLWVIPGVAAGRIVIAVLEPGEVPKHLASTVLIESKPALAISTSTTDPKQLLWTTCYGCAGHGGSIRLDENGRPAFQYR